jgi:type I restriction enzyme M protein
VLFIDGSKRLTKGKNQNELTNEDVDDLFAVYESAAAIEKTDVAARLVPISEIKDNGWDLNIGRYLKTAATEPVDVSGALTSFAEARERLKAADAAMTYRLREAGYHIE